MVLKRHLGEQYHRDLLGALSLARRARGLRGRTSLISSWLHLLKSWSLLITRGGSVAPATLCLLNIFSASLSLVFTGRHLEFSASLFTLQGDVMDLFYLALAGGFFALTAVLVSAFDKLRRHE